MCTNLEVCVVSEQTSKQVHTHKQKCTLMPALRNRVQQFGRTLAIVQRWALGGSNPDICPPLPTHRPRRASHGKSHLPMMAPATELPYGFLIAHTAVNLALAPSLSPAPAPSRGGRCTWWCAYRGSLSTPHVRHYVRARSRTRAANTDREASTDSAVARRWVVVPRQLQSPGAPFIACSRSARTRAADTDRESSTDSAASAASAVARR